MAADLAAVCVEVAQIRGASLRIGVQHEVALMGDAIAAELRALQQLLQHPGLVLRDVQVCHIACQRLHNPAEAS